MPSKQAAALRVRDAVRRRSRQLTGKGRGRAEQAATDRAVPLVSVVLPVSDAQAAYLESALRSVLEQRHERLEILVVPHGRCDRVVASSLLTEDPRVLVCAAVADLGTARDEGAGQARGSYLMFMSASDTIPTRALGALVTTLEESGSDFAVGQAIQPARWRPRVAALQPPRAQRRTTVGAVPHLVTDTHPGNRLFRTSFWRETALAFTGAGAAHSPVVEAYLRSGAFDVVEAVTYRDLDRADGTPVGYVRDQMKELAGWLDQQRATLAVLEQAGTTGVRDSVLLDNWLVAVLEHQARVFFEDLERADDAQWKALREHLDHLVEVGGEPVRGRLGVQTRLRLWLVQQDARAPLEQLLASLRLEGVSMRTSVQDGVVRAQYPFEGSDELRIPESCLELTPHETPLRVCLRNVHWADVHTIELDLFAWIDFVDGCGELPEVEVTLTTDAGGPVLKLPVEQRRDELVNPVAQHRYQDYSGGAMTVRVDAAALVAASLGLEALGSAPSWQLRVRLGYQGVTREGTVTDVDLRGSAAEMETMALAPRAVGSRHVTVDSDPEVGVRFGTEQLPGIRLVSGAVDGRHVTGKLRSDLPVTDLLLRRKDGREVRCRLQVDGDRQSFALDLPSVGYAEGETAVRHWRARAVTTDGREHPVGWPDLGDRWLAASGSAELAFSCSPTGSCNVSETTRTVVVDDIALEDRGIRVRGHWLGPVPSTWRFEVSGRWARLQDTPLSSEAGDFDALLATTRLEWGRETCVPLGPYGVSVVVGEGDDATVSVPLLGEALNRRLLEEVTGRYFRMRLTWVDREPGIVLDAPRSGEERGAFAQNRLRAEYQENDALQVDPRLVYLECYDGRTATDSQLAIAEELLRARPDLHLCWGVWDFSAWVPEGVTRVLLHSREWHRVRTTAGYLVNNIDFERRFRKRPGQRYLQTFHGQPAKSMGIRMWEGKQLTPRMIRAELDRTSLYWDAILTPSPEMDQYYRREYAYDGTILNQGYPRDDVLVSPQADVVRRRTRELLGIRDEQKVVLYAPTWRDNLAVSFSSAASVRHLDIEAASASLGEDYVLLMRGHRFQARAKASAPDTPRFIDVTRYPEVNDLILAADAAVLDYSSLRFDFALTGRPMLFLVPDLDEYTGGVRGFLYPYEDTAPGPLLDTAEQVVEGLRDLDAVSQEYAEKYAAFNATYSYLQDGHSAARVVQAFFGEVGHD